MINKATTMSTLQIIPESELILNQDGSLYHLNLHPEDIADTIILVGDPDRVVEVSSYFDHIEVKKQKREFITHTGVLNRHRLSVISTGIGTDNIDIVLNELDALVNIDLSQKTIKPTLKSLNIIRIGTSGALQADIPVDSLLISSFGLGFDNLLHFYQAEFNPIEKAITAAANAYFAPMQVYTAEANHDLFDRFSPYAHEGITATCSGFYAPQGRKIRGLLTKENFLSLMESFRYENLRITNFEMETSGIYGLGKILGHACLSVNTIIANRALKTFSKDYKKAIHDNIQKTLEILTT
jgi:uridine phosphorylase